MAADAKTAFIRDDIAPTVAAAYQNAKENTLHNARMAHDRALGKVMPLLLKDTKGQSGNRGGRQMGLVRAIREQTDDGEHLVLFMLRVFRGEAEGTRLRDRMEAATWLADRGFSKPIQALEHGGRNGEPLIPVDLLQAVMADAGDHERPGHD